MAAAERFFTQLTNHIIQVTEQLANHVDDNLNTIFGSSNIIPSSSTTTTKDTSSDGSNIHNEENILLDDDTDDYDHETPLQGMADDVLRGIMDQQVRPQTMMQNFHAFRSAITWDEPFIISLIIFHICIFFITIYISKYNHRLTPRLILLILMAIFIKSSEYINTYMHHHYREYNITQNYFDMKGFFMSIMICTPLLFNCFIMLFFYLREASTLLVQVKRAQIQQQRKKQQQATASSSSSSNGTTSSTEQRRTKKDL